MAKILLIAATAAIGFGGMTALGAISVGGHMDAPSHGHDHFRGETQPGGAGGVRGSETVDRRARNPRQDDRLPLAVLVFRSRDGRTCAAHGQELDGRVGAVMRERGRFEEYPLEQGASCIDFDDAPAGVQAIAGSTGDTPTVVFGVAGPTVARILVSSPQGALVPLEQGPRGGFILALDADVGLDQIDVFAELKTGETRLLF